MSSRSDNSECLHASNTEGVPPGTPTPVNFEVYHHPLKDDDDKTDLWIFDDLGSGKSVTNQAYDRVLHASKQLTGQGHKFLYTCAPNNTDHAQEFTIEPVDAPDEFTFSGYFKLKSIRTDERATYGDDLTPSRRGASIRNPAGPTCTSIDHHHSFRDSSTAKPPASSTMRICFLPPRENVVMPSGFMDRWKVTSISVTSSLLPFHVHS